MPSRISAWSSIRTTRIIGRNDKARAYARSEQREKGLEDSPVGCAFTHTFGGKRGLEAVWLLTVPCGGKNRCPRARGAPSSALLRPNLSLFRRDGGLMKASPTGHLARAAAHPVRYSQFEPDP